MKLFLLLAILLVAAPAFSQNESVTIGAIDFYGQGGMNVDQIRGALPLKVGDQLSHNSKDEMVGRLKAAIKRVSGHEPSDVATICCDDRGMLTIYIGLRGESVRPTVYNPTPNGSARLTSAALKVQHDAEQAWFNAMNKGVAGEDDSKGYALSADPEARAKQLELHRYVARHAEMVRRVLETGRDVEQRRIAAEMLGYAGTSSEQIHALIRASHDVDDGVRNNAIRALGVVARSSREAAAIIPGQCFVDLLNSLLWTDRNKSAVLLSALTSQRDAALLACLREQALTSLIEMARWSYSGHAYSARLMLGRIAGMDERNVLSMVEKNEVEPIINALANQKNTADNARGHCPICAALRVAHPARH